MYVKTTRYLYLLSQCVSWNVSTLKTQYLLSTPPFLSMAMLKMILLLKNIGSVTHTAHQVSVFPSAIKRLKSLLNNTSNLSSSPKCFTHNRKNFLGGNFWRILLRQLRHCMSLHIIVHILSSHLLGSSVFASFRKWSLCLCSFC